MIHVCIVDALLVYMLKGIYNSRHDTNANKRPSLEFKTLAHVFLWG